MIFKLSFVALKQEGDFLILLSQGVIQGVDLGDEGLFNKSVQVANIGDSWLSLSNEGVSGLPSSLFCLAMILADLFPKAAGEFFESGDLLIFLFFDMV